jgi:serine/threonine-protein kinase ULK/ATG1
LLTFGTLLEPLPDPTKFTKREGEPEKHARKRKHADMEAEYNAVTCVAVYMLLMSFSQKGINMLKQFQEHMGMKYPEGDYVVSEGFDDGKNCLQFCSLLHVLIVIALNWFKEHFMKYNDRAALVKTWLPAQYDGPKAWLDQLVYDRALVLVRIELFWGFFSTGKLKSFLVENSSAERAPRSGIST